MFSATVPSTIHATGILDAEPKRFPRLSVVEPFMAAGPIYLGSHDGVEALPYVFAFRNVLDDDDQVAVASATVTPSGPLVNQVTASGSSVVFWIGAGGTPGVTYSVTISITTASGVTTDRTGTFDCRVR